MSGSQSEDLAVGQSDFGQQKERRGKRNTRKEIMDAAIAEFARAGFQGASTLVIAKEAGTQQPSLNYHYKSKEKLWQASVDIAFVELSVTFEMIADTACDMAPVDVLKLMVRTLNRFATRHPFHIDIMRQELAANSPRTEYLLTKYLSPMYHHMNSTIESAITAGQIKPLPPKFLSSMIFGAVTHFHSNGPVVETVYGFDVTDPTQAKQHGDTLVEILFEGLAIRPTAGPTEV